MTRRFTVSPPAQREYRVLGGGKPTSAQRVARKALDRARATRPSDSVHVVKRTSGWAIKSEGRERAAAIKATKRQAVESARSVAAKRGARVIEHAADGKIQRNSQPKRTKS